ncbi:MAG: Ig domain-containing protein [Myxococcaceae bacterium]
MRVLVVFAVLAAFASSCTGCSCMPMPTPITIAPDALPGATVGTPYAADLSSPDGRAPITFTLAAGDLPGGMTLTNEGHLSGVPVTDATSRFTVRAVDAAGASGTKMYELVVSPTPISIAPAVLADAIRGVAYVAQVSGSGGVGGYVFTLESGALPPGLTINSGGVISGRATMSGTFTFTLHAVDALGHAGSGSLRLRVVDPNLTLAPATLPTGLVGVAWSQVLSADGGMDPYTFSIDSGALPPGLTLSSSGLLSGVPTAAGVSNFTVLVLDANGNMGTFPRTITVSAQSITVTPDTLAPVELGTAVSIDFGATGGTAPYTFSVSAGTLPGGLTLSSSGHLSGTALNAATLNFNVQAIDATSARGEKSYALTIVPATLTINPPSLPAALVGSAYSQQLTTTGGTGPWLYQLTTGSLPVGLTLSSGGLITGTPSSAGTATFTVHSVDQFGNEGTRTYTLVATTITLTVTPATLPAAVVSTPYSQTLSASGGQAPYTFTLLTGTPPAGLSLSSSGLLSGTPASAGTAMFTVLATDSNGATGQRSYSLDVSGGATGLTISPATLPPATVGTSYSAQLSASGGTAPYTFGLNSGALPAGLSLSSAGLISGTPTALAIPQSFRVMADDGTASGTIDYTLDVRAADGGLTGTGTCAAAYSGGTLPFTATDVLGGASADDSLCSAAATSGGEKTWRFVIDGGTRVTATVTVLDGGLQPVISLRRNACDPTGFGQACAMSGSAAETTRVVADDVPAGVYFVTVDSEQLTSGVFRLDVALSSPAIDSSGASCATPAPLVLSAGAVELEATTNGATDDGELDQCSTAGDPDRNYLYTAPASGQTATAFSAWTLEELGGNVVLGLRAGCDGGVECRVSPGNGLSIGGAARLTRTFDAGTSTQVWVDVASPFNPGATLPFHLRVREAPVASAAVGDCSVASTALTQGASFAGTTLGLTSHFGNPTTQYSGPSCTTSGHSGADTVYRFVPSANGSFTFRLAPERGADFSMIALSQCDPTQCLGVADPLGVQYAAGEPFSLTVSGTAGQPIYLVVDTASQSVGTADQGGFIVSVE